MSTTPMFAPDGTLGDIPAARVPDALKAGFKRGIDLMSPQGQPGTIPEDRVLDALSAGFVRKGSASIPSPQPNMQQVDITGKPQNPAAAMAAVPGGSSNPQPASDAYALSVGLPVAAAATYMGGGLPFLARTAAATKQALPYMVAGALISKAREIPGVGKYIPPNAEMIPWFFGGKGAKPQADPTPEPQGATDQTPGQPYMPNPRYTPPPEPTPLPQRNGPLFLKGEVGPTQAQPTVADIGNKVESALGGKPLAPDAPLRQQLPFAPKQAPQLLPGHTAVESSWMKSYKYDPMAHEFEMQPKSGSAVRLGDVSPEDAQAFINSESKGQAWQQVKNSGTAVAKYINGKWQPIKAAQ